MKNMKYVNVLLVSLCMAIVLTSSCNGSTHELSEASNPRMGAQLQLQALT